MNESKRRDDIHNKGIQSIFDSIKKTEETE